MCGGGVRGMGGRGCGVPTAGNSSVCVVVGSCLSVVGWGVVGNNGGGGKCSGREGRCGQVGVGKATSDPVLNCRQAGVSCKGWWGRGTPQWEVVAGGESVGVKVVGRRQKG